MHHKNKTILWVGTRDLSTSYTAATQRTQQIVEYTTIQWQWTWYFASSSAGLHDHTILPNTPLPESLPHQIDVLWFDRYFSVELFLDSLTKIYPNARRILDLQDLHSLREYRRLHQNRYQNPILPDPTKDALPIQIREYAAMLKMHYIISTATEELSILSRYFPNLPPCLHIALLPHPLGVKPKTYSNSTTCYFIGNASQAPNKEAVHYLTTEFWPAFHKTHPRFSLEIIGAGFENTLPKQNHKLNISCKGTVENLHQTIDNKIGVFPLQHGAGTKGKILECLASGNPCVTTPIGSESISQLKNKHAPWIARSEKQLAHAILTWSQPNEELLSDLRNTQNSILQTQQHKDQWIEPLKQSFSEPNSTTNRSLETQAIIHFQTKYYHLLQRYITLKNDT